MANTNLKKMAINLGYHPDFKNYFEIPVCGSFEFIPFLLDKNL